MSLPGDDVHQYDTQYSAFAENVAISPIIRNTQIDTSSANTTFKLKSWMEKSKVHSLSSTKAQDSAKNVETEENENVRESLTTFASNVSILGIKNVVDSKIGWFRRVMWLVFVLTGFGFLIFHLKNRIDYYWSNPVSVNIELHYVDFIPFPAVTICNNNKLRVLNLYHTGEIDVGYLFTSPTATTTKNLSSYNWTEFITEYGHDAPTMLNAPGSCEWNAQPCSVDNFTRILTEMGVCYTFNHGDTNLKTELLGSTFGLKLILNAEQYNYLATTHSAGFTVLLHHPDDVPYIENLGFQVAPGESISVGISQTKVTNLPSPYGNCAEKNLAYYDSYSTLNCIAECTLNFTMDNCGCRAYYMINVPGVPECSPTQWWECLDELRANTSAALQACACPVPCEEVHYGYTISHSKMSNAITAALMAGYPGTTEDYFRDNYLILQIFYKELNFQGIEQQPAYSGLALFSDIGGALGLVLGSTLMTAAEIIDFAVSLCLWVAFRRK